MQKLICLGIIMILFFSTCKKDKDDTKSVEVLPFRLEAPACLMSRVTTEFDGGASTLTYQYDSQKRLILKSDTGGTVRTAYTYVDDKMIAENFVDRGNGDTVTIVTTNYLNAKGFVSRTVEEDGTQFFYTYNEDGYLIRLLIKEEGSGYTTGNSYEYTDGNRTTWHKLDVDAQTGETINSTLAASYIYYDKLPGKMEAVWAWFDRQGRGNRNELKSTNNGGFVFTYEYLIGSNSLPKSMNHLYEGDIALRVDFEWKCN